jgi:hypothetical protein
MEDYALSNLIRERGFDRFQDGLKARFYAYQYELTYGEITSNSGMWIDFENSTQMGRMTVWESGECDIEVLNSESGKQLFWKHYELPDEIEFHQCLANFFLYFRDGKELP